MSKNNRRNKKFIGQVLLALSMAGLHTYALAQSQMTIENNQLTISGGSGTTFTSQSPTISNLGVVATVQDVPSTNGVGIPSFSFSINTVGVADGEYNFRVGVVIDDDANQRRLEAKIETLTLKVEGNTVTGTIPAAANPNGLRLLGRDGSGTLEVLVNVANAATNGPVTVSGNTINLRASNLIDRIRNAHAQFDNVILAEFDDPAAYTYRIAVQQTSGATIHFGTEDPFAAFPQVGANPCGTANCVNNNEAFVLNTSELAAGFTTAYTVTGKFNVVFISSSSGGGGGGGGTPPPSVSQDTTVLENTVTELENAIPAEGEIPASVVTNIGTAITNGGNLAQNVTQQAASLTTTAALDSLTTVNKSLAVAGTATQRGAAVDTTAASNTINQIANALAAVVTSRTLNAEEITQINTLAVNTLSSASNLVVEGSTTDNILSVVRASSNILKQAASASGAAVSDLVLNQVKELTNKAVSGVIKNLPSNVTDNVDLNDTEAVKGLMAANPSVLRVALAASATLPNDASITIGGVSFTREELIANSLANFGEVLEVQGGLNFLAATGGFTVSTDSTTGNMTLSNASEKYIAAAPVSRLVSASVPDGISYLPNGTAVLVGNGVATELAPTAFDSAGFTTAVTNAGFQLTYRDNGSIEIALENNERFSAAFGFDNLGSASSCGALTIAAPSGDPTSASYAFMVNCANGPQQRVTPMADNELFYTTIGNAGLNVRTDRDTGIVTISNVGRFKPSFFVSPLNAADQAFLDANQNADGVAFRATDANGDGRMDYEFLSSTGVQLFYGAP